MQHSEKYYVFSKLSDVQKSLNEYAEHIGKLQDARTADFRKMIKSLCEKILETIQLLEEVDDDERVNVAKRFYIAVSRFDEKHSPIKLQQALKTLAASLPVSERNINTALLGRLMNRVKMGYFPTDIEHINRIRDAITFPTDTKVNILDPCCGCGLALSALAENTSARTYGIEIDEYRGGEAQERLNRVGFGSFFHSKISYGAFHCVFLNPPYLSVMTEGNGSVRLEKSFLAGSLPHLMYDGLLIYIIPYYRVTADICKVLTDNFTDIKTYRFMQSEFDKFKQVVIFAKRKKRSEDRKEALKLLHTFLTSEHIPLINSMETGGFSLPNTVKNVDTFKGAVFNVRELANQLQRSNSINTLFDASRLDDIPKHPPLPLSLGQIGLVGSTGMINGLIDCSDPHIVKGRIIKQHKSNVSTADKTGSENEISEVRTISLNRMVFNVLTANGYKSLM